MKDVDFLRARMIQIREKNHKNQSEMAQIIGCNRSTLSRVEKLGGSTDFKTVFDYAKLYCEKLNLTEEQTEIILRGGKTVVLDTSALMKKPQLLNQVVKEYNRVIIPQIVVDELDHIKDHEKKQLQTRQTAWLAINGICDNKDDQVFVWDSPLQQLVGNNDSRILAVAEQAAKEFSCEIDLISDDVGFAARLLPDSPVHALHLQAYTMASQGIIDMEAVIKLDNYYADSYEDVIDVLGIDMPDSESMNSYMKNGNTLIISVIRNKKASLEQRIEKIGWLVKHGADVNRRDCGKYAFPPLSHAVQCKEFEIFCFLLHECQANPNVGSRNPYDSGKIRQKNDGNMPLMIAAWHGREDFLKELLKDSRTSINQQDANGFTALHKACLNGMLRCRDLLKESGADTRIVDRDGKTANDRYNDFLETGSQSHNYGSRRGGTNDKKRKNSGNRW